jgi:hypothetical protein
MEWDGMEVDSCNKIPAWIPCNKTSSKIKFLFASVVSRKILLEGLRKMSGEFEFLHTNFVHASGSTCAVSFLLISFMPMHGRSSPSITTKGDEF